MLAALRVAYDGSNYHGFQYQPDVPTVEGELRRALSELGLELVGYASRTDAGAHARYQVVTVRGELERAVPGALNARLPEDIRVVSSARVDPGFDPRRDAVAKEYRYFLGPLGDPESAKEAAGRLSGEHDFSAFRREDGRDPRVRVEECELVEWAPGAYVLRVRAERFLWEMVRRLAGFVWEVGWGHREPEDADRLLSGGYRPEEKPRCLPAEGLVLWRVEYREVNLDECECWFPHTDIIPHGGKLLLRVGGEG
ncbi:MAG: tRNA pseudouridine(38-40) synthase TruA [Euryarchaeota archaeon]